MDKNLRNRTLALAAVFQCAAAVEHVAKTGISNNTEFMPLIRSLLVREADSLDEVYGGITHLRAGLEVLKEQLDTKQRNRNLGIMRYAISLIHLERRLQNNPDMVELLKKGLDNAQRQADYFGHIHEHVIDSLALLYRETISQLGPRIIVQGNERFLANEGLASLIRVLLLSGVRAAVLWRQAGGKRLALFFSRKSILHEAEHLLAQYDPAY